MSHFARLEHINCNENKMRFYSMRVCPGLFGEWSLVCEWGRIGSPGTVRSYWYAQEEGAQQAFLARLQQKIRRGYHQV